MVALEHALVTHQRIPHLKDGEKDMSVFLNYQMNQLHVRWNALHHVKTHVWILVQIVVLAVVLENAL